MEEYVSKVCTGQFLNHWAFKLMLAGLIMSNVLTIASQTDPKIQQVRRLGRMRAKAARSPLHPLPSGSKALVLRETVLA